MSGVILVVMFPVVIFFMQLLGRQARAQSERQYATYTRLTNRFMDTLRGLPVVKAFGATVANDIRERPFAFCPVTAFRGGPFLREL